MEKFCISILNCLFIFVNLNNADMMKLVLKIIIPIFHFTNPNDYMENDEYEENC